MATTLCLEPTVQGSARSGTMRTRSVPGPTSFEMRLTCISPDDALTFKCQVSGYGWNERCTELKFEAWLATSAQPWYSLWTRDAHMKLGAQALTEQDYHPYLRDFFLQCSIDLFFEGYILTGSYDYDGKAWLVQGGESSTEVLLPEDFGV